VLAGRLRASLLQAAVTGRLAPQDPRDEPAPALLARILEEKGGRGGAGGKKPLPPITADDAPFGLPEGWAWARLGELCDFGGGESAEPGKIAPDAWLLELEDIEKDSGRLMQKKRSGEVGPLGAKRRFRAGQVLYSKLRPYLNKVIVADEDGFCTSDILPLDFGGAAHCRFAQIYLMSPFFVDYAKKHSYGVKMPRLGTKDGAAAPFPLPPLAEQKRIAARLDALLPLAGELAAAGRDQ
jgi:type I restriction enzyme S subunit